MRLALLLFAAVMLVQSQPPSPTPGKESRSKQKESATNEKQVQSDSNQRPPIPVTVNQYNAEPNNRDKAQNNAEQNKSASREWINTFSTVLLALFTLLLAVATAALCGVAILQWRTMKRHEEAFKGIATSMSEGLAATRISADAAKRSSDILVNTERAWLRVVSVLPTRIVLSTTLPNVNEFVFDLENKGRTAASLTGPYRGKFHMLHGIETLPEIPDYGQIAGLIPEHESPMYGRLLAPGELNGQISQKCVSPAITEEVANGIRDHKFRLYFYASLKYFDCADQERELQFCYVFMPGVTVDILAIGYLQAPRDTTSTHSSTEQDKIVLADGTR